MSSRDTDPSDGDLGDPSAPAPPGLPDVIETNDLDRAPVATSEAIASTRASRAWIRVLPALVVLAIILVFVFQNRQNVKISFFAWSGSTPLAIGLLGAAALGALLVLALGSVRIIQLRRQVRRQKRGDERHRRSRTTNS